MASELKNSAPKETHGIPTQIADKLKIGIAVAEWNDEITTYMKNAAEKTLMKFGVPESNIILKHVPGSFELPLAAKYLIDYSKVDGVVCLGCVIEGKTRHFDFVCHGVTQGIMDLNITTGVPVIFGILTTKNQQQAKERAGGRIGNKGEEAALAVLKMIGIKMDMINEN